VNEAAEGPANYWGSIADCDLPFQTFQLFLDEVKQMNDLDMIIWTGDNTPHDIWQQSQTYNLNFTVIESERILKATRAKIVPAMGNH
jgi:sphingomyelin phosphodiesterase